MNCNFTNVKLQFRVICQLQLTYKGEILMGVESKGIFTGPKGSFDDIPRDTLRGEQQIQLHRDRSKKAQEHFEAADLLSMQSFGDWNEDGVFYSRPITWDEGIVPQNGSYGVEFLPDSTEIAREWTNP